MIRLYAAVVARVVPNSATERLVAEMSLPTVSTPGPSFVSHGVVRFTEGDHG